MGCVPFVSLKQAQRPSAEELLQHQFLLKAEPRKAMQNVLSQIFLSNVIGI